MSAEHPAASSSRWEGNGDLLRTQLQETGRIRLAFLNLAELLAVVNDLGIPWSDVEFEDGYAMPTDSSAATPSPREFSIAVKRLHDIHQWVTSGIAETLDKPGGAFLLGVESEAIIDALDYIEGYIYNLEDELGR